MSNWRPTPCSRLARVTGRLLVIFPSAPARGQMPHQTPQAGTSLASVSAQLLAAAGGFVVASAGPIRATPATAAPTQQTASTARPHDAPRTPAPSAGPGLG